GVHYDGHAYATAVLGLSEPDAFRGGLYLQPEPAVESRRFCDLTPGDVLLHRFDLQHGVEVFEGERLSLIFWFKDSANSVETGSTPWYEGVPSAAALYNLGVQYELGLHGKALDVAQARAHYRRSAELGHCSAMNNLALLEEDVEAAERWLRAAARQRHGPAMLNLALLLLSRETLETKEAAEWMRSAAASEPKAAFYLGDMYERGLAGLQDEDAAEEWFQRSAERGFFPALTRLARRRWQQQRYAA
ncbi:Sel1-repeat-containing protein YbeQ, partial [Durusdinium trenchii]